MQPCSSASATSGSCADVLLRYTGPQTSKAGRRFKGFEVFVAGDEALAEGEPGAGPYTAPTEG